MLSLQHVANWPKTHPLCVHAEGITAAAILLVAELHKRPIHICHVARREEVEFIPTSLSYLFVKLFFFSWCNLFVFFSVILLFLVYEVLHV